jgi:hypothetical protein
LWSVIQPEPLCCQRWQTDRATSLLGRRVGDGGDDDTRRSLSTFDGENDSARPVFPAFLKSALLLISPKIGVADHKPCFGFGNVHNGYFDVSS